MKSIFKVLSGIIIGFSLIVGSVPMLFGQVTEEFTLEEITVTAQKREENVQKSAVAITAITGDEIADKTKVSLDEVLKTVPGMTMVGMSAGGSYFIRGIGSNMDTTWGDPGVSLNVDGIYQQQSATNLQSMYDVSRVEVLRGPQGTLYGRNSTGGSINLVTNQPTTEKLEASGSITFGNYELFRSEGMLNAPVNDNVALRIAYTTERREGYLSNGMNAADNKAGRVKMLFNLNDDMSLTGTVEYRHEDGSPMGAVKSPMSSHKDNPWYGYMTKGFAETKVNNYNLDYKWDMNWSSLTLLTSYATTERYENRRADQAQHMEEESLSLELRLNSPSDSAASWVTGLYYYYSKDEYLEAVPIITSGSSSTTINTEDATEFLNLPKISYAAFGQITYPLNEILRLTGGIRYTMDDKKVKYRIVNESTGYKSGVKDYNDSFSSVTYKAGVEYDITENNMIYVSIANGYKAGGLTQGTPAVVFDPETLLSYTIGSKNRFMQNRLQINLEAFYYDFEDYQIQYPYDNPLTGNIDMLVTNASSATNYGLEIENNYLLTKNDKVDLTISYLNTEYGHFIYTDAYSGMQDYTGTIMPNSPTWSGTLGYERSWDLSNGGRISLEGNFKYSQEYYVTFEKYREDSLQPAYHKTDIYLNYGSPDGKWRASSYVKNLENEPVIIYRSPSGVGLASPRTYGVTLSIKF